MTATQRKARFQPEGRVYTESISLTPQEGQQLLNRAGNRVQQRRTCRARVRSLGKDGGFCVCCGFIFLR